MISRLFKMNFLRGIRHWTDRQYLAALFSLSVPLMIFAVLIGYKLPLWWIALPINAIIAGYAIYSTEWPGKNGFKEDSNLA
jgi:hypothetical protein